jgi:hypothetical protein
VATDFYWTAVQVELLVEASRLFRLFVSEYGCIFLIKRLQDFFDYFSMQAGSPFDGAAKRILR